MSSNHIAALLFGLFWFVYFFVDSYRKKSSSVLLKKLVSWTLSENDNAFRCNLRIRDYIHNTQIKYVPEKDLRIKTDEEWEIVKTILESFKRELSEDFFCDSLVLPKSKYAISGESFFHYSLCSFLRNHQCDYNLAGYEMHDKQLEYKRYGSWGGPLFDAKYLLSEFGVVYHKLLYISYKYCKNSKAINPNGTFYDREESISEIIVSRQIDISRY